MQRGGEGKEEREEIITARSQYKGSARKKNGMEKKKSVVERHVTRNLKLENIRRKTNISKRGVKNMKT